MGTFSKSLASCGGFIAGPHDVVDFLGRALDPALKAGSAERLLGDHLSTHAHASAAALAAVGLALG